MPKGLRRWYGGGEFHFINVYRKKKITEKLRYMHRSPVKRGLVESAEQWAWSSYRHNWLGEEAQFGSRVDLTTFAAWLQAAQKRRALGVAKDRAPTVSKLDASVVFSVALACAFAGLVRRQSEKPRRPASGG